MPTERYTPDTEPFEEDAEPAWLARQREDAEKAAELANKNEKIRYNEGDQVGNFLFVRYIKFKNRAMFRCPDCGRQFQYNVYTIRNKKRCKWYKYHGKPL
jgi:transposase-like protein